MLISYKNQLKEKGEVYLRVKVKPNAAINKITKLLSDKDHQTIKIDIAAPPVRGKANQELITLIAREFSINKNNIKIISGAGERLKLVKIVR